MEMPVRKVILIDHYVARPGTNNLILMVVTGMYATTHRQMHAQISANPTIATIQARTLKSPPGCMPGGLLFACNYLLRPPAPPLPWARPRARAGGFPVRHAP